MPRINKRIFISRGKLTDMNDDSYRDYHRRSILQKGITTSVGIGLIGTAAVSGQGEPDEEQYIVLAGGNDQSAQLNRAGYEILHKLADDSVFIIEGPAGTIDYLQSMPIVRGAVANQSFTVEPRNPKESESTEDPASVSKEQWSMEHIRAFDAHDMATGKGTTIAVIDTGVDHTHPDLKSQLDRDRSRLFRNGTIATKTNKINFPTEVEPVKRFVATDVNGHGSHVAGIATAPRNGRGIVGVAPDATLVSLRPFFFEEPDDYYLQGDPVDLLVAIDYAVETGVDVVNISLVITDQDPGSVTRRRMFAALNRVIEYAIEQGTTVVTAMGNQGLNTNKYPGYILPASNPGSISVAAVDETNTRQYDSNFGDSTTTVAAPGERILSAVPEEFHGQQYSYRSQTSVATPHVAGLVCLIRELKPDIHPRKITQAIQKGAVELTGKGTTGLGAGQLDILNTIDHLDK